VETIEDTVTKSWYSCRIHRSAVSNKRLKLAGGDRSNGSGVLCAGEHELSFNYTAPCERVARSLSAIR